MFTKTFWVQTAERAIKTFAQAALALLTASGTNLLNLHWGSAAATAGMAAVLSVLTSLASAGVSTAGSPSLVPTAPAPAAKS